MRQAMRTCLPAAINAAETSWPRLRCVRQSREKPYWAFGACIAATELMTVSFSEISWLTTV